MLPHIRLLDFAALDRYGFCFFGQIWLFEHFGLPTPVLVGERDGVGVLHHPVWTLKKGLKKDVMMKLN